MSHSILNNRSCRRLAAEPLRAEAIGVRVEVYWPGKPSSSWGSVVEYDEESEYYTVRTKLFVKVGVGLARPLLHPTVHIDVRKISVMAGEPNLSDM
jgi:hypothetical protein